MFYKNLQISFNKYKIMHFRVNNFSYTYNTNGDVLNKSTCETIPGVNFDNLLNFDKHIDNIMKRPL